MMMEGMGIKCRPEAYLGTVVDQSLQNLTKCTWVVSYCNNLISSAPYSTGFGSDHEGSYFDDEEE